MHTSTTSTARLDAWTSQALAAATQGQWLNNHAPSEHIQRIVTDSRQAKTGDAFLALKGERFDAHDFVKQVAEQGVTCVIVEREMPEIPLPQLIVKDTRLALGHLGAYRRAECQQLKVVALTGSSGKTTSKEMLGSILRQTGETLITRGNLNNDLGVPMMLLELRQDHRFAVLELGANHIGEIDYTANLVRPDVAGVLNIGTAHMGEFGGRDGIYRAKSEIYQHIVSRGTAIVPMQDDFATALRDAVPTQLNCLRFGQGGDVYAENVQLFAQSSHFDLVTPHGSIQIDLPFAGLHNVRNAEAVASFALALELSLTDIQTGLAQAEGAKGRLNFHQKHQYTLIDDTYNANPTSMRMAGDVLCQQQGIKVMVIGAIGELGDDAPAEHRALGEALAKKEIDYLICVGNYAHEVFAGATQSKPSRLQTVACENQAQAVMMIKQLLAHHADEKISFLFKGSRSTKMENVFHAVLEIV